MATRKISRKIIINYPVDTDLIENGYKHKKFLGTRAELYAERDRIKEEGFGETLFKFADIKDINKGLNILRGRIYYK